VRNFDVIIRGGRWFDGSGAPSAVRDVGIRGGTIAAVSAEPLPADGGEVIDAADQWVMPGMLDIHTHYDAEILVSPGLTESVRHGVTTVVFGNCSLSTVYSSPTDCADMFSRVEAMPREHVLAVLGQRKSWHGPAEYLAALGSLPLGPNVAVSLGHSDVRAAVMGLGRASDPGGQASIAELARMRDMLGEALDAGFVGLSTIRNPWNKLDGDRFRSRLLPSAYARWSEYRTLHDVLRERGAVLQSVPNLTTKIGMIRYFAESSGVFRRPLRTSLLSAADVKSNPRLARVIGLSARAANKVARADLRWQHLPVPFEIYADGISLPVFEEFGSGQAALHIADELERNALLSDESYRRWFRRDIQRRFSPRVWTRDLHDAEIMECPDPAAVGKSFGEIGDERGIAAADAFLDLLVAHGSRMRWRTTVANHRPAVLDRFAGDHGVLIGFSDAGAHLRTLAFYNIGLRLLKRVRDALAAGQPFLSLEQAVHRLTGELADWYGLAAGHARVGDRADLVVVDPAGLDESVDAYAECAMPEFGGLSRMVNRNDRAVTATLIGGRVVFAGGAFAMGFGAKSSAGQVLRPG
jgi:N-acyl-D-aspartate/D-glutamate deacylase